MNKFLKAVSRRNAIVLASMATVAGSASAAVETGPIVAELTAAGTAAAVVGAAVLIVIIGIKAFKYVRSAM